MFHFGGTGSCLKLCNGQLIYARAFITGETSALQVEVKIFCWFMFT